MRSTTMAYTVADDTAPTEADILDALSFLSFVATLPPELRCAADAALAADGDLADAQRALGLSTSEFYRRLREVRYRLVSIRARPLPANFLLLIVVQRSCAQSKDIALLARPLRQCARSITTVRRRSAKGRFRRRRPAPSYLLGKSDPSGATNVEWAQSSCSPDGPRRREPTDLPAQETPVDLLGKTDPSIAAL